MDENAIRAIIREELLKTHGRRALPFPLDIDTLHTLKRGGLLITGAATLTSGVATVEDHRIQASSTAVVTYETPAGTTGTNLKAACTSQTLTITAVGTGGATVTTDTSDVSYLIFL